MINENFLELLERMKKIHESKSEDYSSVGHYENFERQALITSWFKKDIDKAFIGLIAIKLARIATLLDKEGNPNHESLEDSFLDLTVYCGLWASYHKNIGVKTMIDDHNFEYKQEAGGSFCNVCNQHISRHIRV